MATEVTALPPVTALIGTELYAIEQAGEAKSLSSNTIAAHSSIFDVMYYGATFDGVTDDSAAIQAAIDACVAADGGTVLLGVGTAMIETPLQVYGVDVNIVGHGQEKTTLRSNTGEIMHISPSQERKFFRYGRLFNFGFRAGHATNAGHCLRIGDPRGGGEELAVSHCVFERLFFYTANGNCSAIYSDQGILVDSTFRNIDTGGQATGTAPHLHLIGDGGINSNTFSRWRMTNCGTYFMVFDCSNVSATNYNNVIEGINWEVAGAGAIKILGALNFVLRDSAQYDQTATPTDHAIVIGTSTSGVTCKNVQVTNCGYYGSAAWPVDKFFVHMDSSGHQGCSIKYCGGTGANTVVVEPRNGAYEVILGAYCDIGPSAGSNVHLTDLTVAP